MRSRRSFRPRARALWLPAALAALAPAVLQAQYQEPPPPAAYALTGLTVVQPNGPVLDSITVVVRNGLIEAMGPEVTIPPDARVLEGEGLHLYPGLVDAWGEVDVAWPDARDVEDDDDVTAWSPPRSRQGFMPHRRVADHLAIIGEALEDQREDGIVASLVQARGGMAPGMAAVLMHRNAQMPWELVEHAEPGLSMSLRAAGGVYPSQLFGVLAFLRQAFLDAERYQVMRTAQRDGARGFIPPGWDPDYETLLVAMEGELPVFFEADSDEDIRRALDLAEEFGLYLTLVGGEEAWVHAEELAERRIPVLVSLDFPEPDEWDPEADTIPGALTPAAAREKEELENIWSNAARLREAGVTFSLTSGGGDGDFPEGLRKVVEYGLPPLDALRAMTIVPAGLLGLSTVGIVEPGRPATFMVATNSLLQEDARVRYTFVEGRLTEVDMGGGDAGSGEAPAGDLTGSWSGTLSGGGQEAPVSFTLTQAEDGSLRGTVEAMGDSDVPVSGSLNGREVTLRIEPDDLPEPIVLTGTLSEDGNTITGGGSTPFGELEFELRRGGGSWNAFLGGAR